MVEESFFRLKNLSSRSAKISLTLMVLTGVLLIMLIAQLK